MKREIKSNNSKITAQRVFAIILLITLFVSIIYSLIRFIIAPEFIPEGEPYQKIKSDYLLMLFQCIMGLLVMGVPSLCTRKFKLFVPGFMTILYYVFLYCSVFLGEIFSFYYRIPHWDTMLHAMSAAMLATLGFILVDWLNDDEHVKLSVSPTFVAVFAFSFALMIGSLWEIYEYSFDTILGLNMQKFKTAEGVELVGQAALDDTMKDLIIDALAALAVAITGGVTNATKKIIAARRAAESTEHSAQAIDNAGSMC